MVDTWQSGEVAADSMNLVGLDPQVRVTIRLYTHRGPGSAQSFVPFVCAITKPP